MAYVATITKQSVSKATGSNDFTVTIHVLIAEGAETVLEKDYSQTYNTSKTLDDIKAGFQTMLLADWDRYVSEKVIYDAVQFNTLVSQLQTSANAYINS